MEYVPRLAYFTKPCDAIIKGRHPEPLREFMKFDESANRSVEEISNILALCRPWQVVVGLHWPSLALIISQPYLLRPDLFHNISR